MLVAATRHSATACLLGLLITYVAHVAADAHLSAPSSTPMVVDRRGAYLTQAGHEAGGRRVEYGYWVTPPPAPVAALTLALEDRRFRLHPGVDLLAILRAAWTRLTGHGASGGASTIAMQVARMQHPRPRTLWAKALEAGTAVAITLRYGQDAVLAQYLRLAPYGNGSHGIGHAARWYFDKPAADLGWAEAALLASVPQAPALANPHRPSGLARARTRAARALDVLPTDSLAPEERAAARAALAVLRPVPKPVQPVDAMQAALRLRRLARRTSLPDPADPRLRATLDLRVQADATRIARAHLAAWRGAGAQQVAALVVRRPSQEVLALVGSAGWATRPGGAIDFAAADRSPGSTLKPFLYALALERGLLAPGDPMPDVPESVPGIGNADGAYLGPLLPRQALANSRNVPAAALLRRIGLRTGFAFLRELGLHRLDGPADRYGLAMAIGALPTGLDRLVRAYGALAGDGMLAELSWFTDQPLRAEPPRRVLSADTARLVTAFLSDPLARLPSFPRYGASEYPFAVALKTGTSQGYRDAWTVAWSSEYMVGAWIGRTDSGPMAGLSGARSAARLAQALLLHLHGVGRTDLVAGGFPAPPGRAPTELCTGTGRPEPCGQRLTEWLPVAEPSSQTPKPGHDGALDGNQLGRGDTSPRLEIVQPEHNSHLWRNPEAPPALNRLVLRATVEPAVPQILWLVDGQPAKLASPDEPFHWPLAPGQHRFQVRLPLQDGASRPIRVVVE